MKLIKVPGFTNNGDQSDIYINPETILFINADHEYPDISVITVMGNNAEGLAVNMPLHDLISYFKTYASFFSVIP